MKNKKARHTRAVRAAHTAGVPVPEEEKPPDEYKHGGAAKPVSLWPLDFEKAVEGLVRVKWPPQRR